MYSMGSGVTQDKAEAARWYRLSADQGDPDAQYNLGVLYLKGTGVPKDRDEAVRWFKKAAGQNHASAVSALQKLGE
jgi:TPR repeat protein